MRVAYTIISTIHNDLILCLIDITYISKLSKVSVKV